MTEPMNAHLRSWEKVRDIISLNATGVFMYPGADCNELFLHLRVF